LAVITLVAFLAIAVGGIYWASYFAADALPYVMLSSGLLLQVVHTYLFQPCRTEAEKNWDALAFQNRVLAKLTPHESNTHGRKEFILARAAVYDEIAKEKFAEIRTTFLENGCRYRTLVQKSIQNRRDTQLQQQLTIYEAFWFKLEKEYFQARIFTIFAVYLANHEEYDDDIAGVWLGERDITSLYLASRYRSRIADQERPALFALLSRSQRTTHLIPFDAIKALDDAGKEARRQPEEFTYAAISDGWDTFLAPQALHTAPQPHQIYKPSAEASVVNS
jgi:hypothetical protein